MRKMPYIRLNEVASDLWSNREKTAVTCYTLQRTPHPPYELPHRRRPDLQARRLVWFPLANKQSQNSGDWLSPCDDPYNVW
jgi:hypothetical protein